MTPSRGWPRHNQRETEWVPGRTTLGGMPRTERGSIKFNDCLWELRSSERGFFDPGSFSELDFAIPSSSPQPGRALNTPPTLTPISPAHGILRNRQTIFSVDIEGRAQASPSLLPLLLLDIKHTFVRHSYTLDSLFWAWSE